MSENLLGILDSMGRERGIDREILIEAVEAAILSASKKAFKSMPEARVSIDRTTGKIGVFSSKKVVDRVTHPSEEIGLTEVRQINPDLKMGDECEVEVTPRDFGRIAAQTARQVIIQKIREAERDNIYREYEEKQGEITTGAVERFEHGDVIIDLGNTEALLPQRERCPGENFRQGDRITAYILEVRKASRGPQIILSRTHPGLVRKLFELEVPEIHQGAVEIKSVAREPGERSKVAVSTSMENVDSVGTCVGVRGTRIKSIMRELRGERIDIVRWDEDPVTFITNALSPAKIMDIKINSAERQSDILVSDEQLSLAIGKKGQNVRLAAKLTGWRINIRGQSEAQVEKEKTVLSLTKLPGVGRGLAEALSQAGFHDLKQLAGAEIKKLTEAPGIGKKKAEKIIVAAKEILK
ncbi:transcription termination factor NusA [candidate division NPL-UPA2 bacterium]|nr:transcription termination factor NusA [candidate division NPL-UPA2 bacterium]